MTGYLKNQSHQTPMIKIIHRGIIGLLLITGGITTAQGFCAGENNSVEGNTMKDSHAAPSGKHPGEVFFDDQIAHRQWVKKSDELPQTLIWVLVKGAWHPVLRIEITGTVEKRRMTKYGANNKFLETTIQSSP